MNIRDHLLWTVRKAPLRYLVVTLVFGAMTCNLLSITSNAAVLPEERADVLYHSYDGGGVTVDGPSVTVRKQVSDQWSISGNYYIDSVSSASIDVVSSASPYSEERTQVSGGVDYLRGETMISASITNSDENDYTANTFTFDISQDMFGDLTNLSMGYSVGDDEVRENGNLTFKDDIDRQSYRLNFSQILTRDLIVGASYEVITDEGYLNNPYRRYRYLEPTAACGCGFEYADEVYPRTRTSNAFTLRGDYYLPYRAALHGQYRFFNDTWGIDANSIEIGYTQPLSNKPITFDLRYRYYTQDQADFYSDAFNRVDEFNFLARDKELSTFDSHTIGFGVSYKLFDNGWSIFDKGSVNFYYDKLLVNYDNFRDVTKNSDPTDAGNEPLYDLDADIIRAYVSLWF
ncbi:MAG: DUF3570 domain-containing protein [Gammaproteobacteria bacterium]|nr:DUF3570 domain-containing protein [Gammaproteobacteria bacterium]